MIRATVICAAVLGLATCDVPRTDLDASETAQSENISTLPPSPADPPWSPPYEGPNPMPVRIGLDGPDMDACGTYAQTTAYAGDIYVGVHDAPSWDTKERDRLEPGQGVAVCDKVDMWAGVIYSKTGEDCGTGSPVATEQPYRGPCAQGWVDERFVEMIAG